jgi:hypothetical protein
MTIVVVFLSEIDALIVKLLKVGVKPQNIARTLEVDSEHVLSLRAMLQS